MTPNEKAFLLRFFNNGGYVLNFSTNEFNNFTMESIGIPLCEHYRDSKGKSLSKYIYEAKDADALKLLMDLCEYYKLNIFDNTDDKQREFFEKCLNIIAKESGSILEVPTLRKIDNDYITSVSKRAFKDIDEENFDSAFTKARTLAEEVFCHVIELKGETPSESGSISDLYKQVKSLYNMHNNPTMDKRINGLLSGLNQVVTSLGEMRNKDGDAHGLGTKRIPVKNYHARLYVNAAVTLVDFILAVANKN